MSFARRVALLLPLLLAGCGSGQRAKDPVAIPEQPDAGAEPRRAVAMDDVAARDAGPALPHTIAAGANGPRDASGMIGAAGAAVTGTPEMTAFINTAEMRAHPKGEQLGRPLVASLVGWNTFMPHDLVHPLRETNWVLMSGSLFLGATQKNVILASHTLDDKRADGVSSQLEKRLPGKRVDLKVAGTKALEAEVDGAQRAYVRVKTGVLAIVPSAEGKRVAELLRSAEISPALRKGELVRIVFARLPRQLSRFVPVRVGPSRIWIEADGKALTLNGEADCNGEEEASHAAERIRAALDGVRGIEALAAGALTREASVWPDGKVVRYRAELDERILALFSMAVCDGDPACGIPP